MVRPPGAKLWSRLSADCSLRPASNHGLAPLAETAAQPSLPDSDQPSPSGVSSPHRACVQLDMLLNLEILALTAIVRPRKMTVSIRRSICAGFGNGIGMVDRIKQPVALAELFNTALAQHCWDVRQRRTPLSRYHRAFPKILPMPTTLGALLIARGNAAEAVGPSRASIGRCVLKNVRSLGQSCPGLHAHRVARTRDRAGKPRARA
jgi:hypothetical protein